MACSLAVPVFATPLVEMQPLDFLPQRLELQFPEVLLESTRLKAALEAPAAPARRAEFATKVVQVAAVPAARTR